QSGCFRIPFHGGVGARSFYDIGRIKWVELDRALEVGNGFGPATLAPVGESDFIIESRVIWQDPPREFQFRPCLIVISTAAREVVRPSKVHFSRVGLKTSRFFDYPVHHV